MSQNLNSVFIDLLTLPFPPPTLGWCHSLTFGDSSISYQIGYLIQVYDILNPKEHKNPKIGSIVLPILLKGWIWPIGGVTLIRVSAQPAKQVCLNLYKFNDRPNTLLVILVCPTPIVGVFCCHTLEVVKWLDSKYLMRKWPALWPVAAGNYKFISATSVLWNIMTLFRSIGLLWH